MRPTTRTSLLTANPSASTFASSSATFVVRESADAPSWWFIVAANLLLGVNQGLAWSMTVIMKIDLAGPRRRGLALGLNEAAGYLGVAATAFATGLLAVSYAPRTIVWVGATLIVAVGLFVSVSAVRDTGPHGCPRAAGARRPRARERRSSHRFPAREPPGPDLARLQSGWAGQQPQRRARVGPGAALPRSPRRQRAPDRDRRRRLPGRLGCRPTRSRLAFRLYGPKAANRRRHARPGGRARPAGHRRRRLRSLARRSGFARRRNGDGLPDTDRRSVGRQPAARPRACPRRLPLLAGLRLRARRPDRRDRRRRRLPANGDP